MQPRADGRSQASIADASAMRIRLIAERAAETLQLSSAARAKFISNVAARLVFAPRIAAAGTVMEPRLAQQRQFWRALYESRKGIGLSALVLALVMLTLPIGWQAGLIISFVILFRMLLLCWLKIRRWRASLASAYAALPPPGSIILADPAALTVNGIVIPWNKVLLEAIGLRWLSSGLRRWRTSECIDRITLIANGMPLMLDRSVMTDGQEVLDTICDKLDLTARPAAPGDVNIRGLPLYPRPHPLAGWPPTGATMTTFDKREEGFEKKFAHDEELRFKASARRNKLLGLWAAEKLGLSGAEAEAYAKDVVMADFEEAGDNDVFKKIRKDFDAKTVAQSDHQIRRTMDELMAKAIEELKAKG
jgi:hypothetical protein